MQTKKSEIQNLQSEIVIDVLCVGHASFDITLRVARHPGADEKCFAESRIECGGGPAANAAVTVARLGGKSAFAGYLGNDVYGQKHFEELQKENVNTDLIVRGERPTPLSVVLVKPGGKRTVINHKKQTPPLPEGRIDFSSLQPAAILFDGHEPLLSIPLARQAREKGIPTLLDAGSVHAGTIQLAPVTDYLIASRKFAGEFTGEKNPEDALKALAAIAPFVIITLGEEGLIWAKGKRTGKMAAFPVEAVDTTGAGDAFHGAFAAGIARGYGFEDNLVFASAAAALTCTKSGGRVGLPGAREVEQLRNQS